MRSWCLCLRDKLGKFRVWTHRSAVRAVFGLFVVTESFDTIAGSWSNQAVIGGDLSN